jgi:hypothetical protein
MRTVTSDSDVITRTFAATLALGALLASAPPASAQMGDDATSAWTVEHATTTPYFDRGRATSAAGTVAVTVGEMRDVPSSSSASRYAFARGFGRDDGLERWSYVDERCNTALAVSVDPSGQRALVVERLEVVGSSDGTERTLVLDTVTGTVVTEAERPLQSFDARSKSVVDTLVHAADGSVVYRLDFYGIGVGANLRLEALDPDTAQVLWSIERAALEPFEFYESSSGESLAVSPDGAILYVAVERPDSQTGYQDRDTELLALSAIDGSELWRAIYATPGKTDRISRPMPTADSSGVCIVTHFLPQPATLGPVRRLSALDGSEIWSTPTDFTTWTWRMSPDSTQVVVGGWIGFGSPPNGTDLALQSFDVATGASMWSMSAVQAGTTDEPIDLAFAPDGSRVYASIWRGPLTFPYDSFPQIASVDASTGGDVRLTDVGPPSNKYHADFWIDAVARPGGGSQAAVGHSRIDVISNVGLGSDPRAAVDDTGSVVYAIEATQLLDQDSDAIGRVWLDADGEHLVLWKNAIDAFGRVTELHLERRRTDDGTLVASFVLPSLATSSERFDPEVSPSGRYVALQHIVTVSPNPIQRALSVYDIDTGQLILERVLPNNGNVARVAWSDDDSLLAWAQSGSTSTFGVLDVNTGQTLWQESIAASVFFYGTVSVRGLTFDPSGQTFTCLLNYISILQQDVDNYILVSRDAVSGQSNWRLDYNAEGSYWSDPSLYSTTAMPGAYQFGVQIPGATTSPDGSVVYTADVFLHPLRPVARVAATSATNGDLIWTRGTTIGPGEGARLVSLVTSADGRYVHVLCEGRGDVPGDPLRAYVATWNAATGAPLWQRFLDDELVAARRLVSLGAGDRIAVLGTLADTSGRAVGGSLVVLEASSGTELYRVAESAERGEWLDVAADRSGRTYVVGAFSGGELGVDGRSTRYDGAAYQMGPHTASVSSGARAEVVLDFQPDLAGDAYIVLGSATGAYPGTAVGGGFVLPLVVDAYTDFTLVGANSQFLPNSFGMLDAYGDAHCGIAVPPGTDPVLAGLNFCYAALVVDPLTGAATGVTQPVLLTLAP